MRLFHKVLPTAKRAYLSLQDFTQDLQNIYTDISAVSVTLCNSGNMATFGKQDSLHRIRKLSSFSNLSVCESWGWQDDEADKHVKWVGRASKRWFCRYACFEICMSRVVSEQELVMWKHFLLFSGLNLWSLFNSVHAVSSAGPSVHTRAHLGKATMHCFFAQMWPGMYIAMALWWSDVGWGWGWWSRLVSSKRWWCYSAGNTSHSVFTTRVEQIII